MFSSSLFIILLEIEESMFGDGIGESIDEFWKEGIEWRGYWGK